MAEFMIESQTVLERYNQVFGNTRLCEISGKAFVSLAVPRGGEAALAMAVKNAFDVSLPDVGKVSENKKNEFLLLGIQPEQYFMLFEYEGDQAVRLVTEKLGDVGYYTDQSDGWTMLEIDGPQSQEALQRICMLDLHVNSFAEDAVSRTIMEHLGVIIMRKSIDSFYLMSARSSAHSFLHAVEISLKNVV